MMKKAYVSPAVAIAQIECEHIIAASPDGSITIGGGSGGGTIFEGGAIRGEWNPVFHSDPDTEGWDHHHRNELF